MQMDYKKKNTCMNGENSNAKSVEKTEKNLRFISSKDRF